MPQSNLGNSRNNSHGSFLWGQPDGPVLAGLCFAAGEDAQAVSRVRAKRFLVVGPGLRGGLLPCSDPLLKIQVR
jgi:hypothetical protein